MRIPHTQLVPATLRAVVLEFVTRDGTDHSPVEKRVESVLRQLEAGRVELYFDEQTETCNIVPVEGSEATSEGGPQSGAEVLRTADVSDARHDRLLGLLSRVAVFAAAVAIGEPSF